MIEAMVLAAYHLMQTSNIWMTPGVKFTALQIYKCNINDNNAYKCQVTSTLALIGMQY